MADSIKATPQNQWLGALANALKAAQSAGDTVQIPFLGGLGSLLLEDYAKEAEELSYGNAPMTVPAMTRVPQFKKGRADVYGGLAFDATGAKGVAKVADKAAMAVGKAGERYAEKVVPQIMEKGGLGAGLLSDLAQGSRSQIFIGPEAKTWRKADAFKASQMEKAKADGVAKYTPEEIWKATGTFRGPDGFWRQEIDDSASKFISSTGVANKASVLRGEKLGLQEALKPNRSGQGDLFPKQLTEARRPLRERVKAIEGELGAYFGPEADPAWRGNFAPYAYEHQALYEAYPQLRKDVIRQGATRGDDGVYGTYSKGQLDITKKGLLNDPRSTATHEFQHAIQDIEGFTPGGNPEYARDLAREALAKIGTYNDQMGLALKYRDVPGQTEDMRKHYQQVYDNALEAKLKLRPAMLGSSDPYQAYRNIGGEAEARAVQARLGLSGLQRRERFPLLDYDVPQQDLILPQNETMFTRSLLD